MVSTQRAAVLIVMACIIAPMLVGYAWPDERVERMGWESGEAHDITSSLRVSPVPTYALDSTIVSPSWSPAGSGYTDTTTGAFTLPSSTTRAELVAWMIAGAHVDLQAMIDESETNGAMVTASLSIATSPPVPQAPVRPSVLIPTSIVDETESESWTDVGGLDSATVQWDGGQLASWSANGWTIDEGTPAWDSRDILIQNVADSNYSYTLTVSYVLPAEPVPSLQLRLPTPSIRGEISVGLTNVIASTTSVYTADETLVLETIVDDRGVISGRVVDRSEGETLANFAAVGTTSTISWLRWTWDTVSDRITLSTMTGEINKGKPFETVSASVRMDAPISSWYATFSNETGWRPQISAYDNLARAGSTLGILNATIRGGEYYPDGSWQIEIKQPSTIGESIRIGGSAYQITAGTITVGDTEVPIRGLTVFSAGNGDGTSNVYANGILVASNVRDASVTLDGIWNTTVILYDMDSYTYWEYEKHRGGFGLDVVGFCAVGLLTSIGAFVAAVIASRRSGGSFAILAIVAGICAAFFFIMLSNNINL